FIELKKAAIMPEAVRVLPAKLVTHYKVMPVELKNNVIKIAVHDPSDHWPLDDIEVNYGLHPVMVLACRDEIADAIRKHYGVGADTVERIMVQDEALAKRQISKSPEEDDEQTELLSEPFEEKSEEATVVRLVDQILREAVRKKASDIHIERGHESLSVRYRVDGVLGDVQLAQEIHYLAPAITSRIKIMSGMDIVEKRLPQDGRSHLKVDQEGYDLRISILPSRHGEDIAIRLLPSRSRFSLEDLGMKPVQLELFKKLINKPHGILFVTGPTGSGKSTTLYTGISQISSRERKIITVEDPVEYEIPGITQIQVNAGVGLTFARTLRNMLRHDPDVIMIGEVRDSETAEIAVQAALTGHLVFSTLHTNDAASGVTRLIDMGIEPFLIVSSVEAFVAQRLIRLVCPDCKTEISPEERSAWEKRIGLPIKKLTRGRGCDSCDQTGYKGRTAIYEILLLKETIRDLVLNRAGAAKMKEAAVAGGMQTLWDDGWEKAWAGETTPEEIIRVVGEATKA
ncbi:MAG: type II/IV secretion system protein, partial [Deltaproteobacteria bacterium]|nr:type II/IV secretion system protein [Deltaproteobacteria bacterium]